MYCTLQLAVDPLPTKLHGPLNVPVLLVASGNEPVDAIGVPAELSLITMLHVSGFPISVGVGQPIPVVVERLPTLMVLEVPELVLCVKSPL